MADTVFPEVLPFTHVIQDDDDPPAAQPSASQASSAQHDIDPAFQGDDRPTPIADTPPRRRTVRGGFHELTPTQDMARALLHSCPTPLTGGQAGPDQVYIGSPGRRADSLPPRSPSAPSEQMAIDSHQRAAKRPSSATGRRVRFATTPTHADDPRQVVPIRNGQDSDSPTI